MEDDQALESEVIENNITPEYLKLVERIPEENRQEFQNRVKNLMGF